MNLKYEIILYSFFSTRRFRITFLYGSMCQIPQNHAYDVAHFDNYK